MAFVLWMICSLLMIAIGIRTWFAKEPAGFFTFDSEPPKVDDAESYNHDLAKLWWGYGVFIAACGIPLINDKPGIWFVIPMLGAVFSSILLLIVYSVFILPRHRKK